MSTIDIKEFSKYLVYFFNDVGDTITNKKLQKLLYYIQAWHLVYFENHPLFDEYPEAWVHGPVYKNVYELYRHYKASPIHFKEGITREALHNKLSSFDLNEEQNDYLQAVLRKYGKKTAFELELMTHSEKPWLEARKGLSDYALSTTSINPQTMKVYYSSLIGKTTS